MNLPFEIVTAIVSYTLGTDPRSQPAVEQPLAGKIHAFTEAVSGFRFAFKVKGSQEVKWVIDGQTEELESKRPYLVRWWPLLKSDFHTTWNLNKDGDWVPGKMRVTRTENVIMRIDV